MTPVENELAARTVMWAGVDKMPGPNSCPSPPLKKPITLCQSNSNSSHTPTKQARGPVRAEHPLPGFIAIFILPLFN